MNLIKRAVELVLRDKTGAGADSAARNLGRVEERAEGTVRAVEKTSKVTTTAERAFSRIQRRVDPLGRATERLKRDQDALNRAFEQGVISADRKEDALRRLQREYDRTADRIREAERAETRFGKARQAITRRGAGMAAAGLAVAGSLATVGAGALGANVIKDSASLEAKMSEVRAVTRASREEMALLTDEVRDLGATTPFTAGQVGDAVVALGMAGLNTTQILSALEGQLDLAASGNLALGEAADIATNILTQFGLEASQTTRVADVLARASTTANTTVQQLGEAMKFVGGIARQAGVSLETTSAALQVLANRGLKAEMGGTGLRKVLITLAAPSEELAEKMGGATVAADGLLTVLQNIKANGALSIDEVVGEFGERGGPAMLQLLDGLQELERFEGQNLAASLERASKALADTRIDNLQGDVKSLTSAWSELSMVAGDAGTLANSRELVQTLTTGLRSDDAKALAETIGQGLASAIDGATSSMVAMVDVGYGVRAIVAGVRSEIASLEDELRPLVATMEALGGFVDRITISPLEYIDGLRDIGRQDRADRNRAAEIDPAGNDRVLELIKQERRLLEEVQRRQATLANARESGILPAIAEDALERSRSKLAEVREELGRLGDAAKLAQAQAAQAARAQADFDATALVLSPEKVQARAGSLADRVFGSAEERMAGLTEKTEAAKRATEELAQTYEERLAKATQIREAEQSLERLIALQEAYQEGGAQGLAEKRETLAFEERVAKLVAENEELKLGYTEEQLRALAKQTDELGKQLSLIEAQQEAAERALTDRTDSLSRTFEADLRVADDRGEISDVVSSYERLFDDHIDRINSADLPDETKNALVEAAEIAKGKIIDGGQAAGQAMADRLRVAVERAASAALQDVVFNGGEGLGQIFGRFGQDVIGRELLQPITEGLFDGEGLSSVTDAIGNFGTNIEEVLSGFGVGEGAAQFLGQAGAAAGAGFAGFGVGRTIGNFVNPNANRTNQMAGGAIGGLGGAAIGLMIGGPIGAAVGAAIGAAVGAIGGSLVGKESNFYALGQLDLATGQRRGLRQRDSSEASQRNAAARGSIFDAVDTLRESFDRLGLGPSRGSIALDLGDRDGYVINGRRFESGDVQGVIDEAFRIMVRGIESTEGPLARFAQAAVRGGLGAQETVKGMERLKGVLDLAEEPVDEVVQAFRDARSTIEEVRDQLISLGASTADVDEVFRQVVDRLTQQINDDSRRGLLALENPALARVEEILREQDAARERAAEAIRQGGNVDVSLQDRFQRAQILAEFNIEDRLAQAENPQRASFDAMVREMGQELAALAKAVDGVRIFERDVEALQRAQAAELSRYVSDLSDEDKLALGSDYLDDLEDFGGRLSVVLVEMNELLERRLDDFEETRRQLQEELATATRFRDAGQETFEFLQREYGGGRPADELPQLRAQAQDLTQRALAGDEVARASVFDVIRELTATSREQNGSGLQFRSDFNLAEDLTRRLRDAGQAEVDQKSAELTTLEESRDILEDIRRLLAGGEVDLGELRALEARLGDDDPMKALAAEYIALRQSQTEQSDRIAGILEEIKEKFGAAGVLFSDPTLGGGAPDPRRDAMVNPLPTRVDLAAPVNDNRQRFALPPGFFGDNVLPFMPQAAVPEAAPPSFAPQPLPVSAAPQPVQSQTAEDAEDQRALLAQIAAELAALNRATSTGQRDQESRDNTQTNILNRLASARGSSF